MGTDETGTARDESPHRATVKMNLQTSKGRTGWATAVSMLVIFLIALAAVLFWRMRPELLRGSHRDPAFQFVSPLELASLPTAGRFDFPIGSEHGALSYNAQPFTESRHLGDDLNGIGG